MTMTLEMTPISKIKITTEIKTTQKVSTYVILTLFMVKINPVKKIIINFHPLTAIGGGSGRSAPIPCTTNSKNIRANRVNKNSINNHTNNNVK